MSATLKQSSLRYRLFLTCLLVAAAVFMLSAQSYNFVRRRAWRILNFSPAFTPCERPYSATSEDGPDEDVVEQYIPAPLPDRHYSREEVSRGGMGPGLSVRQKRVGAQVMAALARELQHGPLRDPLMQDCGFGFLEVRNLNVHEQRRGHGGLGSGERFLRRGAQTLGRRTS